MRSEAWTVMMLAFCCQLLTAATADDRPSFWIDLKLGEPVAMDEMIADLGQVDLVFLGETHRLERHHRFQLEIVRRLLETGRPLVLGLEQIESRNQPEVDRFNAGEIDFDELAEAIDWKKQWNNFADYRAVIEAVHDGGGRVAGLNGPAEVIRAVGQVGLDGLEPEQRKTLPDSVFLDDPDYERLMNTLLMVHASMEKGFLRKVFEAQASRDEAMAASMVTAMREAGAGGDSADDAASKKPIGVVICGSGHCQFGLGTPDRLRRRWPEVRDRIVLMTESGDLVLTPMEKEMMRAMEIHHRDVEYIDRSLADYLHAKEQKPEEEEE